MAMAGSLRPFCRGDYAARGTPLDLASAVVSWAKIIGVEDDHPPDRRCWRQMTRLVVAHGEPGTMTARPRRFPPRMDASASLAPLEGVPVHLGSDVARRRIRLTSTALAMPVRRGKPGRSRLRYRGVVVGSEVATSEAHLRPIERRIRRLVAAGVDPAEVAWRFRRSRRSVSQIVALGSRPHRGPRPLTNPQVLRPLERRILAWREAGASYAEIGARFRRSPQFVRRVEDLARAKLARAEKDD